MSLGVFDFFSGCGGTSKGFQNSGMEPVFALDFDKDAAETFQYNFPSAFVSNSDITLFNPDELEGLVSEHRMTLFCACAPCQPFTRQNTQMRKKEKDIRRSLLSHFCSLVEKYRPDYIFVENVPGIKNVLGNSMLARFRKRLEAIGYQLNFGIVESRNFGVPQRRRRLMLLGSRHGAISFPEETHRSRHSTVREWISHFPPIKAGEAHPEVANHRAANLSELNLRRINATPPEGSRADWPAALRLDCHSKKGYTGHTDVYGRMKWDGPATGLTTRCISLSNGRYGHPEQDRAISVREAAALQTFPKDFEFFGALNSQAKQVGNAVPVLLAQAFGTQIVSHAKQHAG